VKSAVGKGGPCERERGGEGRLLGKGRKRSGVLWKKKGIRRGNSPPKKRTGTIAVGRRGWGEKGKRGNNIWKKKRKRFQHTAAGGRADVGDFLTTDGGKVGGGGDVQNLICVKKGKAPF